MKLWDPPAAALTTGGLPQKVIGAGTTLRVSSSAVSMAYSYTWVLCPAPGSYDSRNKSILKKRKRKKSILYPTIRTIFTLKMVQKIISSGSFSIFLREESGRVALVTKDTRHCQKRIHTFLYCLIGYSLALFRK